VIGSGFGSRIGSGRVRTTGSAEVGPGDSVGCADGQQTWSRSTLKEQDNRSLSGDTEGDAANLYRPCVRLKQRRNAKEGLQLESQPTPISNEKKGQDAQQAFSKYREQHKKVELDNTLIIINTKGAAGIHILWRDNCTR